MLSLSIELSCISCDNQLNNRMFNEIIVSIFKQLVLGSLLSLIPLFALATELSFSEYTKLAKKDPQVLITLLTDNKLAATQLDPADYYLLLSRAYNSLSHSQQAISYAEQGLNLPKLQSINPLRYHQLQLDRALAYDNAGVPGKALTEVEQAIEWAELKQEANLKLSALVTRGTLNISLVNYIGALTDLNLAYQLAAQSNNADVHPAEVAGLIALVYEYRREDSLAIPYFTEVANYQRSQQNWLELSIALYGLGRAEKNIGNQEVGLNLLSESATLAQQVDDWQGVAYAEKEIAGINIAQGNFELAKQRFNSALTIFAKANNPYMQLDVNLSLAKLAINQQDIALAEQHLQQAEHFVDKDTMPIQALAIDSSRATVLAQQGQYQQAYQLLLQVQQKKQQLDKQQSSQALHQLRVMYDLEAKQAENKLLEQSNELHTLILSSQKQRYVFLIGVLGLSFAIIVLLVVLYYRGRKHQQRLEQLADTDGLTAVYNRRKVMQLFQQQYAQAERYNLDLSIAILDLDWFKQINDTFGHQTGDEVLWRFAAVCRQQLRKTDIIGRIGGEEFLIIFPSTCVAAAEQLANRLCIKARDLELALNKPGLMVSVSIGVAANNQRFSANECIAAADEALYVAKKSGRNQVQRAKSPLLIE